MKRKGFTLVELLVVIAIIAMLMGILMPALARVRQIAYRMICGTNLSGIGKAMLIYSNDNEEDYPKAGHALSTWSVNREIRDWSNQDGRQYGMAPSDVTITSSLYLLIRDVDLTPKQFVCKGDVGTKAFKLSDARNLPQDVDDITDVWDFGDLTDTDLVPGQYCSYSYHMPYFAGSPLVAYPIIVVSNPAYPVCADRNPYLDKNAVGYLEGSGGCEAGDKDEDPPTWEDPYGSGAEHYFDEDKTGNAAAHQREGQNVLFNDQHVTFEKYPNCGFANDNIWKAWTTSTPLPDEDEREGASDSMSPYCNTLDYDKIGDPEMAPKSEKDAFLVNEYNEDVN